MEELRNEEVETMEVAQPVEIYVEESQEVIEEEISAAPVVVTGLAIGAVAALSVCGIKKLYKWAKSKKEAAKQQDQETIEKFVDVVSEEVNNCEEK